MFNVTDTSYAIHLQVKHEFQRAIKGLHWPYKFCWMDDLKTRWDGHKNLLVLFERPNAKLLKDDHPSKEKLDFLAKYLPRLKNSKLKRLCGRILSYHEYDNDSDMGDDNISLSNRFTCLTSVPENGDLFDLDYDEPEEALLCRHHSSTSEELDGHVFNLTEDGHMEDEQQPQQHQNKGPNSPETAQGTPFNNYVMQAYNICRIEILYI